MKFLSIISNMESKKSSVGEEKGRRSTNLIALKSMVIFTCQNHKWIIAFNYQPSPFPLMNFPLLRDNR